MKEFLHREIYLALFLNKENQVIVGNSNIKDLHFT